ncbi:hypothetical protein HDU97_008042, partial [Phlyctochytrium planicorne]
LFTTETVRGDITPTISSSGSSSSPSSSSNNTMVIAGSVSAVLVALIAAFMVAYFVIVPRIKHQRTMREQVEADERRLWDAENMARDGHMMTPPVPALVPMTPPAPAAAIPVQPQRAIHQDNAQQLQAAVVLSQETFEMQQRQALEFYERQRAEQEQARWAEQARLVEQARQEQDRIHQQQAIRIVEKDPVRDFPGYKPQSQHSDMEKPPVPSEWKDEKREFKSNIDEKKT